jgi:hypothetical protein
MTGITIARRMLTQPSTPVCSRTERLLRLLLLRSALMRALGRAVSTSLKDAPARRGRSSQQDKQKHSTWMLLVAL